LDKALVKPDYVRKQSSLKNKEEKPYESTKLPAIATNRQI